MAKRLSDRAWDRGGGVMSVATSPRFFVSGLILLALTGRVRRQWHVSPTSFIKHIHCRH